LKVYLKKLIISNFKTFCGSEAKELIFSKGYTILSGPNGSGKSNTLDAILFVLGRHDDRLKRTVAEVISKDFNTNALKADYAEVKLIFSGLNELENEDESGEIVVLRQIRIPGSGKPYSLYKLNGKETTLNEILKILPVIDYNIVKQGEITSRMYETPESRRNLIEKIAGLAQLDPFISESTAKIMNTKENLKRVGLLLKDAQGRLQDLEREKNRTLKYRELENELNKFKSLKIFSTKSELQTKLDEFEEQIKVKNDDIAIIQAEIVELKKEIDQITVDINSFEQQKREFERQKTEISVRYEMDLKTIDQHDQRLTEIQKLIKAIEERIDNLKEEIQKSNQEKQKIIQKIKKSAESGSKLLNQIKELSFENKNMELALPRLKETVNELDMKRTSLITEINEKEKALHKIDIQITELRQKRTNLEEKVEELGEMQTDQSSNLGKATRELKRFVGEMKVNIQKIEKLKQEIVLNSQFLDKQSITIQEYEAKVAKLQKDSSMYQQLLHEAKPNYSLAVQKVLAGRDNGELEGVIGTVIELIEDIKSEYAIAIEVAGGGKLQNIVTEDFETTKDVINYVKRLDIGKITFYPLDTLSDYQLKQVPNDPKVLGRIIDLIKFDRSKYQKVMVSIFKNTLLVKDLDTAKKYRAFRTVTLEGDSMEPGGWVTTRGKFEPRFLLIKEFYRKKVTELKAELDNVQQVSKKLKVEQKKLEDQTQKKQTTLEELVNANNVAKGRILELQNRIRELENNVAKCQSDLEQINTVLVDAKVEEQNAHLNLSKILEELEGIKAQKDEVEGEIANTELGKTEQLLDKNRREILKLRENVRGFEKEREIFNTQVTQIESNIELITSRITDSENRINNELLIEKENVSSKKNEILAKIEAENSDINVILENITKLEANQKDLHKNKENLMQQISSNNNNIEDIKKFIADELQPKKIRIELRIQELEKQIQELGFEFPQDLEINLEQVNQEINRLELEISSLGLIDQQAPEKYEAENIRLNELTGKKDIYEKELEMALETKTDLLTQKKLKFLQAISDINNHLNEIFMKLYGKGRASLVLIDQSQPLESGVDIEVDVGNGTVDFIGTLSGGEKSMVALAFIFAIQKYKSAPIYFLDEIDSYLDDSHCEALGRLLKDLSRNSQYIVITPRLNALSSYADRIYGVWLENGSTEIVCQRAEDYAVIEEEING